MDQRLAEYAENHTTPPRGLLAEVAAATRETTPNPQMMSGIPEARLLEALVAISGARRVLEVGTFTGFGALSMAAALPDGGELITIEYDASSAEIARRNIERSSYAARIELIVGDALEEVSRLEGPFDLVYIDAWKRDYVTYYEAVVPKLAPRGLIVADNVLYRGDVLDPGPDDESARALAAFNDHVHADPRVRNVLLTIGDGYMLAWPDSQSGRPL
jgi:caffeoyl-CoA O-methyltransferase